MSKSASVHQNLLEIHEASNHIDTKCCSFSKLTGYCQKKGMESLVLSWWQSGEQALEYSGCCIERDKAGNIVQYKCKRRDKSHINCSMAGCSIIS